MEVSALQLLLELELDFRPILQLLKLRGHVDDVEVPDLHNGGRLARSVGYVFAFGRPKRRMDRKGLIASNRRNLFAPAGPAEIRVEFLQTSLQREQQEV